MVNSRPIPEIRQDMKILALSLKQSGMYDEGVLLMRYANQTYRRSPKFPRAAPTRGSLTPYLAAKIREYKEEHPTTSNRRIGEFFSVDGGRVSEAIHGTKGL